MVVAPTQGFEIHGSAAPRKKKEKKPMAEKIIRML